jgi:hypothetical protein
MHAARRVQALPSLLLCGLNLIIVVLFGSVYDVFSLRQDFILEKKGNLSAVTSTAYPLPESRGAGIRPGWERP